jgi:membrane protein YdbS with pleckstrin-like domain
MSKFPTYQTYWWLSLAISAILGIICTILLAFAFNSSSSLWWLPYFLGFCVFVSVFIPLVRFPEIKQWIKWSLEETENEKAKMNDQVQELIKPKHKK